MLRSLDIWAVSQPMPGVLSCCWRVGLPPSSLAAELAADGKCTLEVAAGGCCSCAGQPAGLCMVWTSNQTVSWSDAPSSSTTMALCAPAARMMCGGVLPLGALPTRALQWQEPFLKKDMHPATQSQ